MIKKLFQHVKCEKGSVTVIVAVMMVVVLSFTAFAVDMGVMYNAKSDLQNIADAAALSGAQELPDPGKASETAMEYAQKNGLSEGITITTPYDGDSARIEVVCTQTVSYTFARVLGFEDQTVAVRAVAKKASMGGAFDYTLFSGSASDTLTINGSDFSIQGDAHSNEKFRINGSNQSISGTAEAVSSMTVNGSHITIDTIRGLPVTTNGSDLDIGQRIIHPAPWIDMPDFSDIIQAQAMADGQYYEGNMTFSGSYLSVDGSIYVNGNVTVNGSHFFGNGCILATGNLVFNGSNLTNGSGEAVCFYSKNGNITINGSCAGLCGIIYAPNGTITMNGSNQSVHGRVIGNKVRLNGSNMEIIGGTDELQSIPSGCVKLVE